MVRCLAVVGLGLLLAGCAGKSTSGGGDGSGGFIEAGGKGSGEAGSPSQGKTCGGIIGRTCTDQEYCAYQPGQACGAADASSTCQPRPSACDDIYAPVCGCDSKTYPSDCDAASHGTGVLSVGTCPKGL